MADTIYLACTLIHNFTIENPDKPKEWISVFKSIIPMPIHIHQYQVIKDSVVFETDKGALDDGDWFKFSFTGKLGKNGIKGILKNQSCSHYDTTQVYEDKNIVLFKKEK
jgi:hypothetical protein